MGIDYPPLEMEKKSKENTALKERISGSYICQEGTTLVGVFSMILKLHQIRVWGHDFSKVRPPQKNAQQL